MTADNLESFIRNLRRYDTVKNLRVSEYYDRHGRAIEELLQRPIVLNDAGARPGIRSFLRVAQWNIEKGKRYQQILDTLKHDQRLKWADIVLLNESDIGMNRSGNRHIAHDLARELGMNMVFGPAHIELTKGTDEDLLLAGENRGSLQGNAVLSRYPVQDASVIQLPVCFEPFEFHEKRYGRRNCVWARIRIEERWLWVGALHLEVRNTPACRAAQMAHVLSHLPGNAGDAYLLGGDFNSNTFPRDTRWRTLRSSLRRLSHSAAAIREELCHPERKREPLFSVARNAGFFWKGLNSDDSTASAPLGGLEDSGLLPPSIVRLIQKRLAEHEGFLHFKLDWLLASGVQPLARGEVTDPSSGLTSADPGRVPTQRIGSDRVSDHNPIYADLRV